MVGIELGSQDSHHAHILISDHVLRPILIYINAVNDLHWWDIKHSETFHFADDTHLLHFSKTIASLCSGFFQIIFKKHLPTFCLSCRFLAFVFDVTVYEPPGD